MFLNTTSLIERVTRRLGQVPGPGAQFYAEDEIRELLREAYNAVRAELPWDHLMRWVDVVTLPTTGWPSAPIASTFSMPDRFADVEQVVWNRNNQPIPILGNRNPASITGDRPRYVEPLTASEDPSGAYIFKVHPITAVTTTEPLRVRVKADPLNLFDDPTVIVPFDSSVLINRAAAMYAASDGQRNEHFMAAYNARMNELRKAHNSVPIIKDARSYSVHGIDTWVERD